jgi:hypothetical protein
VFPWGYGRAQEALAARRVFEQARGSSGRALGTRGTGRGEGPPSGPHRAGRRRAAFYRAADEDGLITVAPPDGLRGAETKLTDALAWYAAWASPSNQG